MSNSIKILFLSITLVFSVGLVATAQETAIDEINEIVNLDENIQAEDLGVGEPRILPDSPIYFMKDWSRGIRSLFTFNPIAKAELKLKFANEKLMEAKKLAETKPEVLPKALDNYKDETDRLKERVEKIKETAENPKLNKFIDKFIDNSLKQQKLLGKFEKELPPEVYEKIKAAREENLTKFSDIGLKFIQPEVLKEKIIKITNEQQGSQFKHFKNLEVLQELEDKVPEAAKEAIRKAQENSLKRLQGNLEKMSPEDRERFKDYVGNIGGDEVRHLEIIHQFENREIPDNVREIMEKSKEKNIKRIEEKIEGLDTDERKEKFLKHLEKGKMKNLRIIKELENNLSPEVIDKVLGVKNRTIDNFRKNFEATDTQEKQDKFLKNMEKFHDVKQLEIFKEVEGVIAPEKIDFWKEMKEKTIEKMKQDVENARDSEHRKKIFERLSSSVPGHIGILEEFELPKDLKEGLAKKQAEKIGRKIGMIEDPTRFQIFKQKIEGEERIRTKIASHRPNILQKIEEKEGTLTKKITLEMVEKRILRVKEIIRKVEQISEQVAEGKELLGVAKKHLEKAESSYSQEKLGEAFGQANAAMYKAQNILNKLKRTELKEEVKTEREGIFKKRFEAVPDFEMPINVMKCPITAKPVCAENQKLVIKKTADECLVPVCITLGETSLPDEKKTACSDIWLPVCGKDGKTYSNNCYARTAGVEISYKGKCRDKSACIQVITPAMSPDGACKKFPTPCDVPETWKKVDRCPLSTEKIEIEIFQKTDTERE